MKKSILSFVAIMIFFSCSKSDDDSGTPDNPNVEIKSSVVNLPNFNYKQFYQENPGSANRKGLIILAHGDGANENDGALNDQCTALAQQGYVAITTSYRSLDGLVWNDQGISFKADIESVILDAGTRFAIPRNKTILGGLSRGGSITLALVLPNGQFGTTTPFDGIKGAVLQCSGGDEWKGSAVLFPVAWMSNKIDDTMGVVDGNNFKNGLQSNLNPNVSTQSECLIYNNTGHCSNMSDNKAFIVRKVKEWLP